MNARTTSYILVLFLTAALWGQQSNSANHSMTINGVDGAPFPILTNVRTNLPAVFTFGSLPLQPYMLFQGNLHAGSSTTPFGIVDLDLSPFPVKIVDGFANPAFRTDSTGVSAFAVQVPGAGSPPNGIPLGLQVAEQSVIGDPFNSPYGQSLTAATRITVTSGPIVNDFFLGDESVQILDLTSMPIPFYGINYTTLYLDSNGYLCFGATDGGDFQPAASTFASGPPRLAPFWCDLVCGINAVRMTLDANPGSGAPGYLKIEFTNVSDFIYSSILHSFSMLLRSDGSVEIASAQATAASTYDQITGIGPGGGLGGTQPQKNFVGYQPPGSTIGTGILTTPPFVYVGAMNESFFEWFGIVTANANYGNAYNDNFDLYGMTLHFVPGGMGTLPAITNRYTLY